MMDKLAVIIPVFGEKELVGILYNRLKNVLATLPVESEIIYVNDACPFGSGEELAKIAESDDSVTLINLSRNFGETNAVKAGIDNCFADYAVVMDCDLQDLPEDIPLLYNKAKEGYDVVWGERVKRDDNFFKKFSSDSFYFFANLFSEIKINKKIGSFSVISKKVIKELQKINDYSFSFIQNVEYLGFKKAYVPVTKSERPKGKSAYNFVKSMTLALKILVSTSDKPLLIPVISSFILFLLCFLGCITFMIFVAAKIDVQNILFLGFCLFILLLFAILFLNIGIIGIYTGIILKETLSKPRYVIEKKLAKKDD